MSEIEKVNQACANIQYAVNIDEYDLIVKEDLGTIFDYVYNKSIPKEKVRELLDEQYELYNSKDQAKTDFSRMYTLEELLEE